MTPKQLLEFLGIDVTDRQRDVLELAAQDYSPKEICQKLHIGMDEFNAVKALLKRAEGKQGLNVSEFGRVNQKMAKFRQIINRAMLHQGLDDLDQRADFIQWAIGDDYATLAPQDWPARITDRAKLRGIDQNASVYIVISAAVQIFLQKKVIVGSN